MLQIASYGAWRSPITPDLVVAGGIRLGDLVVDGSDVYWSELRPSEAGRSVVVRRTPEGQLQDVTPPPFNARTRVHEYGGGVFAAAGGTVYFANDADQRVYRVAPGAVPVPITPETAGGALRYADFRVDGPRARLIAVREDHTAGGHEPANTIVAVALDGGRHDGSESGSSAGGHDEGTILASGHDFYASPRLSLDGTRLAWLSWDHPNMPWDGADLWVAEIRPDGALGGQQHIAGGAGESIFQPEWSPDGTLYFVSDRSGWWNLYRWRPGAHGRDGDGVEPLTQLEAEFGVPQWVFGLATYAVESPERIICRYSSRGTAHLAALDTRSLALEPLDVPFSSITAVRALPGHVALVAASATSPASVVLLDLVTGQTDVVRRSSEVKLDPSYLSAPEPIEFPTDGGVTAHGLYYAPRNGDFAGPEGERPPLLVKSHGGPTSATGGSLDLAIQYWTSRGVAVLDVNYGGSTGYGREYRERLNDRWGIVDVDDCCNGARALVARGVVDGNRLIIAGGSAGGYTTLCALTFRDVFKVGASYYGVSDLEALARDTHKFESRYLDGLVGPYPERRDRYYERSPINFVDRLSCPVIFFQGLDDPIVPPNQAELMVAALRQKGLPVAYVTFAGERHGFRRAENIKRALEAELYFYSRILAFPLADPIDPVAIENL